MVYGMFPEKLANVRIQMENMRVQMYQLEQEVKYLNAYVQSAGSDSPSPTPSEEPSERSTCEPTESNGITLAEVEAFIRRGSKPRKVWAIHQAQGIMGLFSSEEAALMNMSGTPGWRLTEYEVEGGHQD